MIVEGRITDLIFIVSITIFVVYALNLSKRWTPKFRTIPGLNAIEEAVGRAVELGRPVHFTTGQGGYSISQPDTGTQIMAGLSVFNYVAQLCAKMGVKLIVSVGQTETIPILEQYIRDAYNAENLPVPDMTDTLRFHGTTQYSFITQVQSIFRREHAAANIVVGPLSGESGQLLFSGVEAGAIQVTGTGRTAHIPWLAIISTYSIMGEEIYAAGALLSDDKETLNTIWVQDIGKLLSIIVLLLGVIFTTLGSDLITLLLEA